MAWLFQRLFDLSPRETSFEARGFRGGTPQTRARLEWGGAVCVEGYRTALRETRPAELAAQLDKVALDLRGFAYEGASMGLALQDYFTPPWRWRRVRDFLVGPGDPHAYMVHVGVGWILGRLPGNVGKLISLFGPLLRWLIVDGYGF